MPSRSTVASSFFADGLRKVACLSGKTRVIGQLLLCEIKMASTFAKVSLPAILSVRESESQTVMDGSRERPTAKRATQAECAARLLAVGLDLPPLTRVVTAAGLGTSWTHCDCELTSLEPYSVLRTARGEPWPFTLANVSRTPQQIPQHPDTPPCAKTCFLPLGLEASVF